MTDFAAKSILIVHDSSTMRRILINALMKCGFTKIGEAANGVEGLAKSKTQVFDCVITDWNMPEMDGLEMAIQIRKDPNYDKIPIMMVTTEGGKEEVIEALTQGVDSYVVKPFTPDVLGKKMEELFAKQR